MTVAMLEMTPTRDHTRYTQAGLPDRWGTLLLAWSLEPENSTASHLWCGNFTGYQYGKGSDLRQPFWSSSAFMDWLQNICLSTASWRPAVHICDQPTRACCPFRVHGQLTATGVLLSVDQSRGTVYVWHCVLVTSRRRLSEDIWRHFCLTVLTISYVRDSYRDIDSYVTILPSLPT